MLTVITFTSNTRDAWLKQCTASITKQITSDAMRHIVVQCPNLSQWTTMRLGSLDLGGDYVAFVDDDDLVLNDSLGHCLAALEATGAGIAFTRECLIDAEGALGPVYGAVPQLLGHAGIYPHAIHHLAVMRRSSIDVDEVVHAIDGIEHHGIGTDWALKANAAARGGAVHVPVTGYGWRRHSHQMHNDRDWITAFHAATPRLKDRIGRWFEGKGQQLIPTWELK